MRLLNTKTMNFYEFFSDIPRYAILSHTWSDGEVSFQDMSSSKRFSKKGFAKISKTCELARTHGLGYAWVDTCCIDKSSSAELTEAINSMYQWYLQAALCYVYLEDLPRNGSAEEGLPNCRWFTRGWTLQELLAPKKSENVYFYDMKWNFRGSKLKFIRTISKSTGISKNVLLGAVALAEHSIAERMSWAARRETSRTEDTAYCLLGIFNVNMPLLYGEGAKSFRRLQEEIVKRNNDLTILAWEDPKPNDKSAIKLFAESPAAFTNSSWTQSFNDDFVDFSVTNNGLFVSEAPMRVVSTTTRHGRKTYLYALILGRSCKTKEDLGMDISMGGIYLRKLGPKLFTRDLTLPLAGFGNEINMIYHLDNVTSYYILTEPNPNIYTLSFWRRALHVPSNDSFEIKDTVPETLWDVTNSVFLKPKPYHWTRYPMVIAIVFQVKFSEEHKNLVVLCDYRGDYKSKDEETTPSCKVFWKGKYPREEAMIFQEQNRNESIYWSQLEIDAPHILQLSNSVETMIGEEVTRVSACFEKGVVGVVGVVPSITAEVNLAEVELFSLKFNIT